MPPLPPEHARWFTEEVQPHEHALRAYLQAAAPNRADVDDLMQESYLRLLRARSQGPIHCVRAFVFAIARNAVRDAVRDKLANREISGMDLDSIRVFEDSADVVSIVSRRQEQALLAEAIRDLPERCRNVLLMRKIHGLSQKEIARKLRISENTVESLISRGVRRCANYLRARLGNHLLQ